MSDMPERIYAKGTMPKNVSGEWYWRSLGIEYVEYIRADLHEALAAEKEKLREAIKYVATQHVLETRGSYDAPGFDACVEAEIETILKCGK